MTENQRLKLIQKVLSFKSQEAFANALGIKQGSLSDIYREKKGIGVSDSIKMKLSKGYSINIDWLETGEGEMIETAKIENRGCQTIGGNVMGDNTLHHNEGLSFSELKNYFQEIQSTQAELAKEFTERLKISQEQISVSQKQISDLIAIIKTKNN